MNAQIRWAFCLASLLAISIACSVGCKDPLRSKIVGTWTIERADRVMSRVNASDDGETDSIQTTNDGMNDTESKMALTFHANGTMKTKTNMGSVAQEKIGSWTMKSFDSESNRMQIECVLQQQKTEHEVDFVDENQIELVPPNMAGLTMKIKFNRR